MGTNVKELHPVFADRLLRMMDATGTALYSGYRSSEEQAELYRRYLAGTGNPANPAGESNHEAIPYGPALGLAADLSGNLRAAHDRCAEFGIHFPILSTEPWHCQPVEVPRAYYTGMPFDTVQPEPVPAPWTQVRRVPSSALVTSAQGFSTIAHFEGFRGRVYRDPVGIETIGYGETRSDLIEQYRASGISQEDAYKLLIQRVEADFAPAVRALDVMLAQSEFDALVSFAFNLGAAIFDGNSTIGKAIKASDYPGTANAFMAYTKAWDASKGRYVELEGLKTRRLMEADLFRSQWGEGISIAKHRILIPFL